MSAIDLRLLAAQVRARPRGAVIIGVLILCAVVRLKFAYLRAALPFQVDYEEGNLLNAGLRITHLSTPYPPAGSFPYVLNPYGPVGYLIAALGIKLVGLSLFGPRLLVLLAGMGVSLCVFLLAVHCRADRAVATAAAILFFCSPLMWVWLPLLRVDVWAIFLSLAGFYVFARHPERWHFASILFALALLTKPTAIAAPSACFFEFCLQRKIGRALRFSVLTGIFILLGSLSLGGAPCFHMLRTHPDLFSMKHLVDLYATAIERSLLLVAILTYAAAFQFRWTPHTRPLWLYFGTCCLAASSGGKLGSNTNHFIELTAALSILTALALQHLIEIGNPLARPLLASVIVLTAIFSFAPQRLYGQMQERNGCPEAYAFVRSSRASRVLSEDVSAVVLSGKPVLVSNPFVTEQLGDSIAWSQGSLEQLADRQYFDLILLSQRADALWSPALLGSVKKNYKVAREFQCLPIEDALVPRGPNSEK